MKSQALQLKEQIFSCPGLTRRALRELTHYDARTIAQGLSYLQSCGLILGRMEKSSDVGRPALHYYPCCSEVFYIGAIYLDLTCLLCLVKGSDGHVVEYLREDFALGQTTVNHSVQRCQQLLRSLESRHGIRISAVGLTMRNQKSARFLPLAVRQLERQLEIPVYGSYPIEAFAWMFRGRHPEVRRLVTLHCRYEIELCVLDGDVVDGTAESFSRDLEHMTGDSRGPLCWCGKRGCLENYINEYLMLEEFRARKGSALDFQRAFAEGDADALSIIRKGESCLVKAFKAIVKRYHPDCICQVLFEDDHLITLMSGLIQGTWIPESCAKSLDFKIYEDHGDAGYECVSATAEGTLYRWLQVAGMQKKVIGTESEHEKAEE